MNRIVLAFRAFFALLFGGKLPDDLVAALGLAPKAAPVSKTPPSPPAPQIKASDGALQLLGMLQREARILDFLMEDIAPYSDEQVGAAAREVHDSARDIMIRHFAPAPVIDAMEGSAAGILRHRGWRATAVALPLLNSRQDLAVLAPAEIEVE